MVKLIFHLLTQICTCKNQHSIPKKKTVRLTKLQLCFKVCVDLLCLTCLLQVSLFFSYLLCMVTFMQLCFFFFFLFFFCQMFTQLIHMLWWLGSNVCVYVAVISVAVTFFDDYSCLSLLIYLKNALALASGNYTAYLYVMMVRF